jgi:hypothetical protein
MGIPDQAADEGTEKVSVTDEVCGGFVEDLGEGSAHGAG